KLDELSELTADLRPKQKDAEADDDEDEQTGQQQSPAVRHVQLPRQRIGYGAQQDGERDAGEDQEQNIRETPDRRTEREERRKDDYAADEHHLRVWQVIGRPGVVQNGLRSVSRGRWLRQQLRWHRNGQASRWFLARLRGQWPISG